MRKQREHVKRESEGKKRVKKKKKTETRLRN